MSIKKLMKNQKGIGLVEVIAALGISIIVITALVSLALFTMRSSLTSKLLLEASKTANKELESVRAYRDRSASWDGFLTDMAGCFGNLCNMDGLTVASGEGTIVIDNETITKSFTLTQESSEIVQVEIEVLWNVGGEQKSTHLYTHLTNWRDK